MAKTHICFSCHNNMAFNSYMEGVFGMTKTKVIGKCLYCKDCEKLIGVMLLFIKEWRCLHEK